MEHNRIRAEIELEAIKKNVESLRTKLKKDTKIMAIIKADAYGHGSVEVAKTLEKIDYLFGFGVATFEEGLLLRKEGITKPILILGYTFEETYEEIIKYNLTPGIFTKEQFQEYERICNELHQNLKVHIKVDTGMARIGIRPDAAGKEFVGEILKSSHIEVEGIYTHFANADRMDKNFTKEQFHIFTQFIHECEDSFGFKFSLKHCANSAAIMEMPEVELDMVRAGIAMYGLWPSEEMDRHKTTLIPAMSLVSHIAYLKEVPAESGISYGWTYTTKGIRKIATIPVGYGDGIPRSLSNKGYVLIRGQKAYITGRVCMDQMMVDVTDINDVKEKDKVTLLGVDGEERITAEEIGSISTRFNYEFVCGINKRVPRVYK